jgi:hypothetical protein
MADLVVFGPGLSKLFLDATNYAVGGNGALRVWDAENNRTKFDAEEWTTAEWVIRLKNPYLAESGSDSG